MEVFVVVLIFLGLLEYSFEVEDLLVQGVYIAIGD
jgi:hypothetical protein